MGHSYLLKLSVDSVGFPISKAKVHIALHTKQFDVATNVNVMECLMFQIEINTVMVLYRLLILQLSDAEHRLTEMEKPRSDDVLWNLPDYLFSLIDDDHSQSDSRHQVRPNNQDTSPFPSLSLPGLPENIMIYIYQ